MTEVIDRSKTHTIVTANLTEGYEVLVIADRSQQLKGYGPWSLVIDESPAAPPSKGVGPSPVDTALSALAA